MTQWTTVYFWLCRREKKEANDSKCTPGMVLTLFSAHASAMAPACQDQNLTRSKFSHPFSDDKLSSYESEPGSCSQSEEPPLQSTVVKGLVGA